MCHRYPQVRLQYEPPNDRCWRMDTGPTYADVPGNSQRQKRFAPTRGRSAERTEAASLFAACGK